MCIVKTAMFIPKENIVLLQRGGYVLSLCPVGVVSVNFHLPCVYPRVYPRYSRETDYASMEFLLSHTFALHF